jgi:thiamine biosynthesis lipoprotein
MLSDYRVDRELSKLSEMAGQATPTALSEDCCCVLDRALHWARITEGAFDPTLGALVALWRQSRKTLSLPKESDLARAKQSVGYESLVLDPKLRTVILRRPGMRLDLGGIAKGFAADAALQVLKARGCPSALVDAGGDLALGAAPPGRKGWRLALENKEEPAIDDLVHCGVATSGNRYQAITIDGRSYSHILDPKSGLGLQHSTEVTVIAADATTADALASGFSVLGREKSEKILSQLPKTQARFRDGDGVRWYPPR